MELAHEQPVGLGAALDARDPALGRVPYLAPLWTVHIDTSLAIQQLAHTLATRRQGETNASIDAVDSRSNHSGCNDPAGSG